MNEELTPVVPEYLQLNNEEVNDQEDLEEENVESDNIDYTTYLQTIIDNQEFIISYQNTIIENQNELYNYTRNGLSALTSILVLSAIVITAFWIVKNIFFKTF